MTQQAPRPWSSLLLALIAAFVAYRASRPSPAAWLDSVVPPLERLAPPPPAAEPETSPAAAPPNLFAGWCAPPGTGESFTIRRTLPGWVQREARIRLESLGDLAPAVVREGESLRRSTAALTSLRALGPAAVEAGLLVAALQMGADDAANVSRAASEVTTSEGAASAAVQVVRALADRRRGDAEGEETALRKAFSLARSDPAIGIALALALRQRPELDEAIAGLEAYLAVEPGEAPLVRLLARLQLQRDLHAGYSRRERDGVVLLFEPAALSEADAEALLAAVAKDLADAARLTGTERRPRLLVVVYPGREELLAVSCVQAWTAALYDGVLRLSARPDASRRVDAEEARHEALHAQLDTVTGNPPRWFEEGLAQYFAGEQGPEPRRLRALMRRNRTYIPFGSLIDSFQVFEAGPDAGLAYAQSLAMVEWLVDRAGTQAIAKAVAALRTDDQADVLALAFGRPVTGDEFLAWLLEHG